jgi:integrase/recombinase XerD
MAHRFDLDRHHHLAGAIHARAWLTMREQFGLAPNTLDAYARAVNSYLAFMEPRDHDCEASTQSDVAGWINESRARGLANSTLIQIVTALRLFF